MPRRRIDNLLLMRKRIEQAKQRCGCRRVDERSDAKGHHAQKGTTRYHESKRGALIFVISLSRPIKTMACKPLVKCRLEAAISNRIVKDNRRPCFKLFVARLQSCATFKIVGSHTARDGAPTTHIERRPS